MWTNGTTAKIQTAINLLSTITTEELLLEYLNKGDGQVIAKGQLTDSSSVAKIEFILVGEGPLSFELTQIVTFKNGFTQGVALEDLTGNVTLNS